jgi:hypothetical protein
MPAPKSLRGQPTTVFTKRTTDITYDEALEEIRRYRDLYPDGAPEVAAFGLIRRAESWEEIKAIEAAVDKAIAEETEI